MRKFFHKLFFPHESNNHRAKILHIDSLVIIIALLVSFSFILSAFQNRFPAVLGISYNITPHDLLNITNQIRQEHSLSPLRLDPVLSQAATNKASDMFAKDYWAHIAPDGTTPWAFIKNSGYEYLYAGENLARGFNNSQDVVKAWMASPTHRENILSPNYSDIGFAISTGNLSGNDTVLIVEMFGTRYIEAESPQEIYSPTSSPLKSETKAAYSEITITPVPTQKEQTKVASLKQQPLVDKNDLSKNIIITIIIAFIIILIIDAIIIQRKKIIRVVSHNLDHIIYLLIILLTIIIISRGIVL